MAELHRLKFCKLNMCASPCSMSILSFNELPGTALGWLSRLGLGDSGRFSAELGFQFAPELRSDLQL